MTIRRIQNTPYGLQTFLGDSGKFSVYGLPTDHDDYILYAEFHGKSDEQGNHDVIKEIALNGADNVDIEITVDDTDTLGVGRWEWGLKICRGTVENTLIPDLVSGNKAYFIVNDKIVEGTDNDE